MKSKLLDMIDDRYKSSFVKQLEEEISHLTEINLNLKKEITMLEKLIELNMNDYHDVVDQRDWCYEEYRKLKEKYNNSQRKKATK